MKDFLQELFDYNNEVNRKMIEHINSSPSASENEKIVHLFSHVFNAHHIWNARIQHRPPEYGVFEHHAPAQWASLNHKNHLESNTILEQYEMSTLLSYTNSKGDQFESKVSDILYHILNHSNYHRAQLNSTLVELGNKAVVTDYIFFKL